MQGVHEHVHVDDYDVVLSSFDRSVVCRWNSKLSWHCVHSRFACMALDVLLLVQGPHTATLTTLMLWCTCHCSSFFKSTPSYSYPTPLTCGSLVPREQEASVQAMLVNGFQISPPDNTWIRPISIYMTIPIIFLKKTMPIMIYSITGILSIYTNVFWTC